MLLLAQVQSLDAAYKLEHFTKDQKQKVGFVYNFAKFINWTEEDFDGPDSPFVITVYGHHSLGEGVLILSGKSVKGHPIIVRFADMCIDYDLRSHIVFIGEAHAARTEELLKKEGVPRILTVSDVDGFVHNGGMIGFVKKNGRLHFQINQQAAKAANIRMSSRLLKLGELVELTEEAEKK